ncbi:hypothetical protein B0H12DRAFT_1267739, partial [Mycena haematopus]
EKVLQNLGLYDSFQHVIVGLREGFDVGIRGLLPRTYLFRQSQILLNRSRIYFFIHRWRTGCTSLFGRFYTSRAGRDYWSISHLTIGPGAQTPLRQTAKCWSELGRFPDSLGHIRQHLILNLVTTARLRCSHIRYFRGIPFDTVTPRSAACTLCILGRTCLRGPSCHVWAIIECGCFRVRGRYAGCNLRSSWFRPDQKMGRRFLCDSSTSPVVDRGRIYCTVGGIRCPMEFSQDEIFRGNPALYWLRLGFTLPISLASRREARGHPRPAALLAALYEPFF